MADEIEKYNYSNDPQSNTNLPEFQILLSMRYFKEIWNYVTSSIIALVYQSDRLFYVCNYLKKIEASAPRNTSEIS